MSYFMPNISLTLRILHCTYYKFNNSLTKHLISIDAASVCTWKIMVDIIMCFIIMEIESISVIYSVFFIVICLGQVIILLVVPANNHHILCNHQYVMMIDSHIITSGSHVAPKYLLLPKILRFYFWNCLRRGRQIAFCLISWLSILRMCHVFAHVMLSTRNVISLVGTYFQATQYQRIRLHSQYCLNGML